MRQKQERSVGEQRTGRKGSMGLSCARVRLRQWNGARIDSRGAAGPSHQEVSAELAAWVLPA
eukprot:scaffold4676_cov94-Isochrysis_galbana.AAC.8